MRVNKRSGNTRCPDSKGIKTEMFTNPFHVYEIPDALIQKGLRLSTLPLSATVGEIPDALIQKGLRLVTMVALPALGNTRCPDSKGIKTGMPRQFKHWCEKYQMP